MRKLKRQIARHNMIKAGYTNLNREEFKTTPTGMVSIGSKFSRNWRDYI